MSTLAKALTVIVVILGIGAGLVLWQSRVGGHDSVEFGITQTELEVFLASLEPAQLNSLSSKPEEKERLKINLKESFALASAALKAGIADEPIMANELENIDMALLAINYDREINKDKGPMPAFGFISEDQISTFWGTDGSTNFINWIWKNATPRWHESEFAHFIDTKIALARKRGQLPADKEPSEKELTDARDSFARMRITYYNAKAKLKSIPSMTDAKEKKKWEDFKNKVEIQSRLQKAQILSTTFVQDVLRKSVGVTDKEVETYVKEHPELTKSAEKKNTANEILKKINEGGDFSELAKEYSEDPGSKSRGGLYEGVVAGQFAPEFEAAVEQLELGKVTPKIVETDFGYHIIKLEKRGETKGADGTVKKTYDARHILISTMMTDPANPAARPMPVAQFVKDKLSKDKQEAALKKVLEENPVSVPEDFKIPEVSEDEMKKMREAQMEQIRKQMQQQQQQGPAQRAAPGRPGPAPSGPRPAPPAPPAPNK